MTMWTDAILSGCGKYRYRLERAWGTAPPQTFVMLNPSTADANIDDPTIRRCITFAKREGRGGINVVNLFALRATNPAELRLAAEPIGPDNDCHIADAARWAARDGVPIICAWGAYAAPARVAAVLDIIERRGAECVCLGRTQDGHPKHPLYVKGVQPLEFFT